METIIPVIGPLTLGGLLGIASGYTAKKAWKVTLLVLGLGFIFLQLLAYAGYIEVNWEAIRELMSGVTQKQLTELWERFREILTHNLPFTGGLIPGFLVGFKKG